MPPFALPPFALPPFAGLDASICSAWCHFTPLRVGGVSEVTSRESSHKVIHLHVTLSGAWARAVGTRAHDTLCCAVLLLLLLLSTD